MRSASVVAAALAAAVCRGADAPASDPPPRTPLLLAERGAEPRYAIRIAEDAGESVRYAALELRDYAERLTEVRLPVVAGGQLSAASDGAAPAEGLCIPPVSSPRSIFLRQVADASLGKDGFSLRATDEGDVVVSGGRRGVLYGVYELLERFGGVGWFASWRTVVPRLDRFEVPAGLDIRERPAIPVRTAAWRDTMRNGDFCARLRYNGQRCPLEARHGGFALRPAYGNGHTFQRYLPPKEFFADHPEYYAEVDGVRDPSQPCLSNPDVLAIFKERVLDWIRKYPDGDHYMVAQNDNHTYCRCAKCREIYEEEGAPSGAVLRFVNAIAEEVEKEFPDKTIETYAYMWSQKPPRHARPRRNVMIYLCNDGTQPPYMDRHKTLDEQRGSPSSFAKTLEAWTNVAHRIHVFDYVTNFSRTLYAFPIELTFAPNLRLYRDCGVEYVNGYGGANTLHSDFAELKVWLYAKLAWNPDQDMEALLSRFFEGYYGAAAPMARAVFDILQREYPADKFLGMYQRNDVVYADETLRRCEALWEAALKAVEGDAALGRNVRMSALTVAYMRFERRPPPKRFFVTRDPAAFAFNDAESIRLARQIRAGLDECPDIRLAEAKSDADEQLGYLARVENAIEPPLEGCDRLALEESAFTRLAWSNRAKFEDDAAAGDGRAMRCFNKSNQAAAQLKMEDVAFDPGVAYRVRVRARIDRGEARDGVAAFSAYVRGRDGDPFQSRVKRKLARTFPVGEVTECYAWFDLPEWVPAESDTFQVMRGSCDAWPEKCGPFDVPSAVWIDRIEVIRSEDGAESDQ